MHRKKIRMICGTLDPMPIVFGSKTRRGEGVTPSPSAQTWNGVKLNKMRVLCDAASDALGEATLPPDICKLGSGNEIAQDPAEKYPQLKFM